MVVRMIMALCVLVCVRVLRFVCMQMLVQCIKLFFTVNQNLHMRARNAALDGRLREDFNAGQAEMAHGMQEGFFVVQKLIQSGHQHIARRAHRAVKI